MLIDTHTHIEGEEYNDDRLEVIKRAYDNGVEIIVNAAYDLESSIKAVELAEAHPNIYACIACHPNDCEKYSDHFESELQRLAKSAKVVGIGEIGLDYHYEGYNKALQHEVFKRQIAVAKQFNLPIVIHSRDADKDTFDILKPELLAGQKVLMHCFGSSYEMAREYVKLGAKLGIGGVSTFKNARKLVEVVEKIDLSHLVLETDAPYLAPTPFRGKRNEPAYVKYTAEKMAELKGISFEEVAKVTTENAMRFYSIG